MKRDGDHDIARLVDPEVEVPGEDTRRGAEDVVGFLCFGRTILRELRDQVALIEALRAD